jgi:short-subunit dehydrogenase
LRSSKRGRKLRASDLSLVENADKEKALDQLPFKPMDARAAAKKILRGVERNRAIIVFPFHARLLWWLNRISSKLVFPLSLKTVRDFRKARFDDGAKPTGRSRGAGKQ